MRSGGGALTGRDGGLAAAGRGRGRFPCPTVGRKGMEGRREGATSVHFSISLSPFGFDRSVSFPSSLSRPSVLCSHWTRRNERSGVGQAGGRGVHPQRSLHISKGRRDGSDRFFSSFSPRKSFGCLLWSPSPSVLSFFNCSTRRDGRTDRRFSLCSDFSHTFFVIFPPSCSFA